MTYVDERIVELRFDNKQFEQETAKSMSTLDKLREKLSFKNASSGAEQLQKAVANINVNPILRGVDTIETKMSALGIAGKRVIENLVDWGMAGVDKIINKLQVPLNQIISGGKTRALNIEQAKFQLEGLGVAWADIQGDISYGVQDTAYGLDAAAKVASQLVASQVELGDDMKHALLGISGVAAMTKSTYEDIGHVYTTVAGNGRLMGEQLLQLSSRGINAAATLATALNTTEAEIRDMVSKGQISFQMFSDAMWQVFGEHAKSANKTFQGALSNTKAALSRLGADVAAQGFNSIRDILNDIIPKLKEFKKGMKPVEDAIITMVDAIGKLVQAFVKAIDIDKIVSKLTPVLKGAADMITEFADAYSLVFTDRRLTRLGDKNSTAFIEEQKGLNNLKASVEETKDEMVDLTKVTDEQKRMAKDIWEKGAYGDGAERVEQLGKDYKMVQAYLEEMIALGWDESKLQDKLSEQADKQEEDDTRRLRAEKRKATIENLMIVLGNLKHVAQNVFRSIGNIISVAFSAFGKTFNSTSLMGGIINLTARLAEISDKLFISRDRAEKLRPIFEMLGKVVLFLGRSIIWAAKGISLGITKIGELYEKAKESERLQKIKDNIVKIFTTIYDTIVDIYNKLEEKGVIKALLNGLGMVLDFITSALSAGVDSFSTIFSSLVDGVGKGITGIVDGLSFLFTTIMNGLKGPLSSFAGALSSIIDAISLKNVVKVGGLFVLGKFLFSLYQIFSNIIGMVRGITEVGHSIVGFFEAMTYMARAQVAKTNMETFVMFISNMTKLLWAIIAFTVVLAVVPNADKMAWQVFAIVGILTVLYGVLNTINTKLTNVKRVGNIFVTLNAQRAQMGILFAGIALMLKEVIFAVKTIYDITNDKDYDPGAMVATLVTVIGVVALLAGLSLGMVYALGKFKKAKNLLKTSFLIISFALSIKMIINSLNDLYNTVKTDSNMNRFVAITGIVVGLYGVIFGLVIALGKLKKVKNLTGMSIMLIAYAVSIKMIISAITTLIEVSGSMKNPDNFRKSVESIIAILGVIGLVLIALTGISALSNKRLKTSSFIGLSLTILSFSALLKTISPSIEMITKTYNEYGSERSSDALWGLVRIIGVLGFIVIAIQALATKNKATNLLSMAGLSLVILALSHAIKTLGSVIKELSGVNTGVIKTVAVSIGILIGALLLLTLVISKLAGVDGAIALLAVAALIISFGASLYLAGSGFKYFGETVTNFINSLPGMITSLISFFTIVKDNSETLKTGLRDTIAIMAEGAILGIAEAAKVLVVAVPMLVHEFTVALVAAIDQLANDIVTEGPEFVDSINNLTAAIAWLWVYASEHAFDWIKDGLKKKGAELLDYVTPDVPGVEKGFGQKITTTGTEVDAEALKRRAENNTAAVVESQIAAIEEAKAKAAKNKGVANDLFSLEKYVDFEKLGISNNATISKAAETMGFDVSKINYNFVSDAMLSDDFSDITKVTGITWGENTIEGLTDAVATGSPDVVNSFDTMYTDLDKVNLEYADDMTEWGQLGFTNYSEGVDAKKEAVVNASKEVQDAAISKILSYEPEWYKAGKFLVEGLAQGISEGQGKEHAINCIADVVRDLQHKAEDTAEIASPSRVFAKIGNYITLGLAEGILELSGVAETATEDVGKDSMSALQSILDRIYDTTLSGMDANPRITPVLDLTELEEGLGYMNGLMTRNSSFGLAFGAANGYNANLAAKFAPTNQNDYDGTNVVDAINGLREDLNNVQDILGGIGFYIDGRQVASAIAEPINSELNDIQVRTGRGVR